MVARKEYGGSSYLVPVPFLSHSLLPDQNEVNMSPQYPASPQQQIEH